MAIERGNVARGALAGAIAAAVWAVQQPLDKLLFDSDYDDVELLGKALTRGDDWPAAGLAFHILNGAAFGAAYAAITPDRRRGWAAGAAAALGEHLLAWPLVAVTDRFHPARDELPALTGNLRAFAQSAWRHALFGAVLGELERRFNEPRPTPSRAVHNGSTNGHGNFESAIQGLAD